MERSVIYLMMTVGLVGGSKGLAWALKEGPAVRRFFGGLFGVVCWLVFLSGGWLLIWG